MPEQSFNWWFLEFKWNIRGIKYKTVKMHFKVAKSISPKILWKHVKTQQRFFNEYNWFMSVFRRIITRISWNTEILLTKLSQNISYFDSFTIVYWIHYTTAVGKQPSIPFIHLGRQWMFHWWWWLWWTNSLISLSWNLRKNETVSKQTKYKRHLSWVFMCCRKVWRRVKTFPHKLQTNLCASCFTLLWSCKLV